MLGMQRKLSTPFLVLLTLPATAMGFALSVQISVLSWILATEYGLDLHEIGLVWAAGPLAGIIGQLLIGVISDRVWFWGGRRRPFIVVGGILAALMILALPYIGVISQRLGLDAVLGVAIAVALALDLSINVSFNPTRSLITDVTPEGIARTRGYTWMQTVSGSFGVLAYAIGAIFGNYLLIYFAAGLVVLFSVVPALLIEEPRVLPGAQPATAEGPHPDHTSLADLLGLIRPLWAFLLYDVVAMGLKLAGIHPPGLWLEAACIAFAAVLFWQTLTARSRGAQFARQDLVDFRKVLAANSLSWIGVQTMFVYMIAFVQQRFPGLDADSTGKVLSTSFLSLNAVAAVLPALVLLPLARHYDVIKVHSACLAVMAAGFAGVYLFAHASVTLYLLMALMGIGWAAIVSLPFSIMSQRVDQSRIGLYMGVFNLSIVLPQLVVSLGVGAFVGRMADKGVIFLIGAVSLGLAAIAWRSVSAETAAPTAAPAVSNPH
ncbi:MAG: MFS transporter [Steroidobacteraceae bacterium]|nr:MFS transporter [Steroidobacteraceae bacterium]